MLELLMDNKTPLQCQARLVYLRSSNEVLQDTTVAGDGDEGVADSIKRVAALTTGVVTSTMTATQLAFELSGDVELVGRLINGESDAITLASMKRWSKAEDEILQVRLLVSCVEVYHSL